jgi:L-arabinose isomerase
MNSNLKTRKARAGLLLIASPRFKTLGEGLKRGTYARRKEADVNEILSTLDFLDIVYRGIVYEKDDIVAAMDGFYAAKVDFVIAEFLSWSEDFAWIRFLRDMPDIPILFVNATRGQMPFHDTLDEDDFIDYLCAGTLVGSLEAAGSVPRTGRRHVKVVMGSREEVVRQTRIFASAARARGILRQSTLGLLANYNEAMWSTYIDPYDLFTKLGPEIRFLPYSVYGEIIEGVSESEVKEYCTELTSRYRMMDDVTCDKFEASVRASIGLARMAQRSDIDIMVFNDIDRAMFELVGLRAGFYHPWFGANTSVLVPEADIGGGIITYLLKLISGRHVNFLEPFHIESDFGTFAGGHAGPNDHNDPAWQQNVVIARDVRFAKTHYKYAGAPFAWYRISPGRKTMAQLAECDGRYKLVATLVDSLEGDHLLSTYSHSIFRPVVPVERFFEQVLKTGTTQHFALVDGEWLGELAVLAEIMDFEYHEIV